MTAKHSARVQAETFLAATSKIDAELPPVLDFEESDIPGELVIEWLELVSAATGMRPLTYTRRDIFEGLSEEHQRRIVELSDLWSANYARDGLIPEDVFDDTVFGGWDTWTLWQWTSSNTLFRHLYPKDIDINYFNGEASELDDRFDACNPNPPRPGRLLSPGQAGRAVEYNARQSWGAGFWGSMIAYLDVSPWQNEGIAQRVAEYQRAEGLDVDGMVGPKTHTHLVDAMGLA
jgi:hypothetical protein